METYRPVRLPAVRMFLRERGEHENITNLSILRKMICMSLSRSNSNKYGVRSREDVFGTGRRSWCSDCVEDEVEVGTAVADLI